MRSLRLMPYAAAAALAVTLVAPGAPTRADAASTASSARVVPTVASAPTRPVVAPAAPAAPAISAPVNCAKVKCIALTFDDGPGPYTARLLATLKAKKVPATFYVIGQSVNARPALVRQMVAQGHEVGTHTWSHPQLTGLGAAGVRQQLVSGIAAIRKAAGVTPRTARPPYGAQNATTRAVAGQLGLALVNWDVDPLDWRYRNSASVKSRVLAGSRNGSIVLMHDIHATTVAAVPGIIDTLRARGYHFVTVSQLRPMRAGQVYFRR